jgi:hypothetical protein
MIKSSPQETLPQSRLTRLAGWRCLPVWILRHILARRHPTRLQAPLWQHDQRADRASVRHPRLGPWRPQQSLHPISSPTCVLSLIPMRLGGASWSLFCLDGRVTLAWNTEAKDGKRVSQWQLVHTLLYISFTPRLLMGGHMQTNVLLTAFSAHFSGVLPWALSAMLAAPASPPQVYFQRICRVECDAGFTSLSASDMSAMLASPASPPQLDSSGLCRFECDAGFASLSASNIKAPT